MTLRPQYRGTQVDLVICFDACASPGRSIQVRLSF